MAKIKSQTPQEIYRAKKQQEEAERQAYLPPGLVNHGNTCFMNSVLQGLIATRLLSNLILFEPISPEVQRHPNGLLLSHRSPQLTNGHSFAGVHRQEWIEGMPIGDAFVNLMYRAWDVQRNRKRESLTPRFLLTTLGRKYDQYMDFAQQDAHEFLRILLDAMRMEEFDIIKKRQPPPPKRSKGSRRKATIMPPESSSSASTQQEPSENNHVEESHPDEEQLQLMSLSDMLFGGRLTSILVCQKCKHVSQTYEDFNDLSLSIKAEDYAKEKKRDRFKNFAKRVGMGVGLGRSGTIKPSNVAVNESPRAASNPTQPPTPKTLGLDVAVAVPPQIVRSSSVPPSPSPAHEPNEPPSFVEGNRRRSWDALHNNEDQEDGDAVIVASSGPTTPDERKIEFAESSKPEREQEKKDKGEKGSSWGEKIGKRISMTVGLGRSGSLKKRKSRSRSRSRTQTAPDSETTTNGGYSPLTTVSTVESSTESVGPEIRLSRPSISPERKERQDSVDLDTTIKAQDRGKPGSGAMEDGTVRSKKTKPRPQSLSPTPSQYMTPSERQSLESQAQLPATAKVFTSSSTTTDAASAASLPKFPHIQRGKSPKPPKASRAETEYLRQIMADVTTSSSWHFGSLYNGNAPSSSSAQPTSPQSHWFRLGLPLASVEECLKMFTAVEVLDGENMVGCRRCWKIANGWYEGKGKKSKEDREEDGRDGDESADDEEDDDEEETRASEPGISPAQSSPSEIPHSLSAPSVDVYGHGRQNASISSLPASDSEVTTAVKSPRSPPPPLNLARSYSYDVQQRTPTSPQAPLPVTAPAISTTLPSPLTARPNGVGFPPVSNGSFENYTLESRSRDSLLSIPPRSRKSSSISSTEESGLISSTDAEDDTSASDEESDASVSVSVRSVPTSSPNDTTPNDSDTLIYMSSVQKPLPDIPNAPNTPEKPEKKPKKPKPTIMRPAYKRYLIASPPPILVIHLKRFQQISSKIPMMSFSSGFKKLEDYVSFPEYLDLTPFLAPRKEDFGLGKDGKGKKMGVRAKDKKEKEKCMYRLYAVVVHIGNMLGGHYIAYTAIPNPQQPDDSHSQVQAPRQWTYISDTIVRLTTLEEVLKAKAYICLYERI
ncbi:hypothetical protein Moror_7048 [Moniliophthora roreri MCA 2997]|uniref:ubiquitinyl hydrolase 1 n=1 Tax=Moniliophthora roreri (strain MCA 2997) TaxID=1381753 RepID=V2XB12_MONRO|nr:hypothetical protein Moror_7048 [Moniliophthora roreri MCA 2997]